MQNLSAVRIAQKGLWARVPLFREENTLVIRLRVALALGRKVPLDSQSKRTTFAGLQGGKGLATEREAEQLLGLE